MNIVNARTERVKKRQPPLPSREQLLKAKLDNTNRNTFDGKEITDVRLSVAHIFVVHKDCIVSGRCWACSYSIS